MSVTTRCVPPVGRGVDVSEIPHMGSGGWEPGPAPERRDYGSFADFSDPDGNSWVLQEARRGEPPAVAGGA